MPGALGTTPATQSMAYEGEGAGGPPPSNAVYVSGTTWVITGNTWITGDTSVAGQVKFDIVAGSIAATQLGSLSVTSGKLVDGAATFAKMQNLSGSTTFIGRFSTGAGAPEELSGASATQSLSQFTSTAQGVVAGSGGGTSNFLRADGAWAAAGGGPTIKYKSAAQSTTNGASLVDVSGLTFAVTSGSTYHFEYFVLYASTATTTGLRLGMTFPLANVWGCRIGIRQAVPGTDSEFVSGVTISGQSVTATAALLANVDYVARIEGVIGVSTTGTLSAQFGSEVAGSTVTIKAGSFGKLWIIS